MNRRKFVTLLTAASSGLSLTSLMSGCASRPAPLQITNGAAALRLALLAPLTGRLSGQGREMEQAARLALDNSTGATLIIEDTGDGSGSASQAVHNALAQGAQAIAGPALSGQTAAVWRAVQGQIPVYSLSNDPALLNTGVLLVGITPDESTAAILRYAGSRGVRRIAVLGDGGAWSRQCAAATSVFAGQLGLETGLVLQAAHGEEAAALARIAEAAPDALLLPPGGDGLMRLSPFASASGIQLLGTHQWTQTAADRNAPPGAWFCMVDPQASTAFADRYQARHGARPGHLGALAHDAVLAAAAGAQGDPVHGATGQLRFAPDGGARRGLAIAVTTPSGARLVKQSGVS